MISKRFSASLIFTALSFILLTSYTNCAQPKNEEVSPAANLSSLNYTEAPPGLAAINYFKTSLPPEMSGATGYAYLLKEYFGPQCGSCHRSGSPWAPYFADVSNVNASYAEAKFYLDKPGRIDEMLRRVTGTSNCQPFCNLDARGQVYKAINFWITNRN